MIPLSIAAVAGFFAARALLDREVPEDCPEPLRSRLLCAQGGLRGWRELAREAMRAGEQERAHAERELHGDYLSRTRRR